MNELHKAYAVLGLDPGSSMESIMRRYKRLIMVWHPDRAPTPDHKEFAEEELKKINNAKDVLTKHFGANGGHNGRLRLSGGRWSGCRCRS
jgi:curved DNA-binding protein CbpA